MIPIQILNGKQCRSRSVGFFRSQQLLIWLYTLLRQGMPCSAREGLNHTLWVLIRKALVVRCFWWLGYIFHGEIRKLSIHFSWKKYREFWFVWNKNLVWSCDLTLVMLNKLRCHNVQPIRLLDSSCWNKFTYRMANSADPDLDLHCLQRWGLSRFSRTRVKGKYKYCMKIVIMHIHIIWFVRLTRLSLVTSLLTSDVFINTGLGKNFSRQHFEILFLFFSRK